MAPEDIPGGGIDVAAAARSCRASRHGKLMSCHLSDDADPFLCAGWAVKVALPIAQMSGDGALPMRMALAFGGVDLAEYSDGGIDLFDSMDEMVEAQRSP